MSVNICPACSGTVQPLRCNPAGLCNQCYGDLIERAVHRITESVLTAAADARGVDCCLACGCLVRLDEVCPECINRRAPHVHHRTAA